MNYLQKPLELIRCQELSSLLETGDANPAEQEEYFYLVNLIAGSIGKYTSLQDVEICPKIVAQYAAKYPDTAHAASERYRAESASTSGC